MFATLRFMSSMYQINSLSRANPEVVKRMQNERLRKLLAHTVANSPLFAEKYRGLDVANCRLSDLPTLTKAEAMPRFNDWVTDQHIRLDDAEEFLAQNDNTGKLFQGKYVLLHTSGSQGQPTVVVQTPANVGLTFKFQATRGNSTGQTGPSELIARFFSPARLAVVTLKGGFYPTAANFDFFPPPLRRLVKLKRWSRTDRNLMTELNAYSPTVISGYTNVLLSLAEDARAGKLHLRHLRHLLNLSEELTDAARDYLMDTFQVPVMNMYATGECGHLTSGCPTDRGCHVNSDWAILENVDNKGRPVPPGERGAKVYITNLANYVQPLIRYEVTDRVTMAAEPCACGSKLPRIERIDGRKSDVLWAQKDGRWERLEAGIFKHAMDYCREVLDWQLRQDDPRRVTLIVALVPGRELDHRHLKAMVDEQLKMYGFDRLIQVDYKTVESLQPDANTAKVKRVICNVGPEAKQTANVHK